MFLELPQNLTPSSFSHLSAREIHGMALSRVLPPRRCLAPGVVEDWFGRLWERGMVFHTCSTLNGGLA